VQPFALKTFHDSVWNRGADGQPTSWVINITGKKTKETTIQMRFGKENDWKSGQVYLFFTRFLPSECLKDVRRCLRKERIGPILKKLRDKEASNPSTTLSTNQALYVLYRNFPGLLPEFQTDLNWLNNFNRIFCFFRASPFLFPPHTEKFLKSYNSFSHLSSCAWI